MIIIELLGVPPIGKGRPRVTRNGTYTPKDTVAYENRLKAAGYMALPKDFKLLTGPLSVHIKAVMPLPASWSQKKKAEHNGMPHVSKPDLDNIEKMLDALNGVVWKDDSQIFSKQSSKIYGEKVGLTVTVYTWGQ